MATKHFLGGRIILGTEFSGYKIRIFEPGTTTPKTTYTDSALTPGNENSDPVVLDSNGAAQIWFSGNAKAVFYTSADVVVYTDDNINLESSSTSAGNYNHALNGSFEDDADGDSIPDNWTRTLYGNGTFALDTTTQTHGDTSIKFTSSGQGGGYIESTANFAVKPDEPYELSFDMKSSVADVRNVAQIFWYKADGTASATASSSAYDDSATNPTSWTRKTFNATVPSDAYFAKIRLTGCHSSDTTAGSTWFDNVEFLHRKVLGTFDLAGAVKLSGDISPSQITANQNDYNPSGLSTASTLRLSSDASRNITGLSAGADGEIKIIHNVGSNNIVLKDESASSSAANRFALDGDVTLTADQSCALRYDSTSSRWRLFAFGINLLASLLTAIGFTGLYSSGAQTITSAGALTLAHGLGRTIDHVIAIATCTTAEGNHAIGDKVEPFVQSATSGDDCHGFIWWSDTTNLYIRFGSCANVFLTLNRTTGAGMTMTNANWTIEFFAYG